MTRKEEEKFLREYAKESAYNTLKEVINTQVNEGRYYAALRTYREGIIKGGH